MALMYQNKATTKDNKKRIVSNIEILEYNKS